MKRRYYSNGKLLITSEYLVLDGAKALALPTKFGQDLTVEKGSPEQIHWSSFDNLHDLWFETIFTFQEIIEKATFNNEPEKNTLISILHEAYRLRPDFLAESEGYKITTELGFPRKWGLGSSSTLINNIAQWLEIDAYTLLKNSFGGSGYDIACAQNNTGITYRIQGGTPQVEKVSFHPECISNLYFLYLNQKQSSKSAIQSYYAHRKNPGEYLAWFDALTEELLAKNDFDNMCRLLKNHEMKMSEILSMPTIQDRLFSDFEGVVKSLGAWGGDFTLIVSKENPTAYFKSKGFETLVPYSEMII